MTTREQIRQLHDLGQRFGAALGRMVMTADRLLQLLGQMPAIGDYAPEFGVINIEELTLDVDDVIALFQHNSHFPILPWIALHNMQLAKVMEQPGDKCLFMVGRPGFLGNGLRQNADSERVKVESAVFPKVSLPSWGG